MAQSKQQSTVTAIEESKVLNGEQQKELAEARAHSKPKKDEKVTFHGIDNTEVQVPLTRRGKTFTEISRVVDGVTRVERYHSGPDSKDVFGAMFDKVTVEDVSAPTGVKAPSDKVKVGDGGAHLTLCRVPLANGWKDIAKDKGGSDTVEGWQSYSNRMDELIELATAGKALAAKAIEQRQPAKK